RPGVLGPSVIRVFRKGTRPGLLRVLSGLRVEKLADLRESEFRRWYERQLEGVAQELLIRNRQNAWVQPGLKWGHANKVLSLYLRDLVLHTRFFPDTAVESIKHWLYAPLDSIAITRLRKLGVNLPFRRIREIDSAEKFYEVQDALEAAASHIRVPRVWF